MQTAQGAAGSIPPLVAYPSARTRASLPPAEWQACLDVWLLSLEYRLRQSDAQFRQLTSSPDDSGLSFVQSYLSHRAGSAKTSSSAAETQLHRRTYLLLRRLLLTTQLIAENGAQIVTDFVILGSYEFYSLGDWPRFVAALSEKFSKQFPAAIVLWKTRSIKLFEDTSKDSESIRGLHTINSFLRVHAKAGAELMAGSDYVEAVMDIYRRFSGPSDAPDMQKTVVEHLYLCLRNLMSDKTRYPSLLLDQLYLLRADADRLGKKKTETKTLLSGLLCTTSFLRQLAGDAAVIDTRRGQDVLDSLLAYREQTRQLFPATVRRRRKLEKGKGKADDREEMHIHQAAQVSQIHELFPDLSDNYIMRLLDHFGDDVEQTTAALLEPASLPPSLQDPNGEMDRPQTPPRARPQKSMQSQVPQRRNVFDDDEFDRMKISTKQLHRGRREMAVNDPELPDEKSRSKAAILAALSALDTDDDERDDTYDVADVGGSVDQSVDTDNRPRPERSNEQNPHEEILYKAWKDNSALFARDSKTRISNVRQDLKRQTGMADEQIEGWAIMLSRDPALQKRLQQKYSITNTFRGNQPNLRPSSWQQAASGENSMDESDERKYDTGDTGDESGMSDSLSGSNIMRGRGRGGGRRGGAGSLPSHASLSEGGRGRGRGRGGRANHNRREGRARKMNRGMAGAPTS